PPAAPPASSLHPPSQVRNESDEAWPDNCELLCLGGNGAQMAGVAAATTQPGGLRQGAARDVTVTLTAPRQPGVYEAFFRMRRPGGEKFGQRLWVSVTVPTL
ncbi:unnamed protein product, partial [Phaeothamnion confervicola]